MYTFLKRCLRLMRRHYTGQTVFKTCVALFILVIWLPIPIFWSKDETTVYHTNPRFLNFLDEFDFGQPAALYIILVMVSFWITKCINAEITCLFPIFMAPLFGIMDSEEVVNAYYSEIVLFFIVSCAFGAAIEYSNLHTRLAYGTLIILGPGVSRLLFGLMCVTGLLSMLVSNAACTSMMIPITVAILEELEDVIGGNVRPYESYPTSFVTIFRDKSTGFEEKSSFQGRRSVIEPVAVKQGKSLINSKERGDGSVPDQRQKVEKNLEVKKGTVTQMSVGVQTSDVDTMTVVSTRNPFLTEAGDIIFKADESVSANQLIIHQNIHRRRVMFLIATAFASNIGGTGMLVGSTANLFCLHVIDDAKVEVTAEPFKVKNATKCLESLSFNAFTWFEFNIFITITNLGLGFLFFRAFFLREPYFACIGCQDPMRKYYKSKTICQILKASFKRRLKALGPMGFHEYAVLLITVLWILLILFERPKGLIGWHALFKENSLGLTTPTVFMALWLLIIPSKGFFQENIFTFFNAELHEENHGALVSFRFFRECIPRRLVLLLGGGIAMIEIFRASGLSLTVEQALKNSHVTSFGSNGLMLMLLCLAIVIITSIIPNTTTSFVILPYVKELAFVAGVHPLYFILPASTCCSYAFLLKSSSQSNLEVASVIRIQESHFMKSGIVLLAICLSVMLIITHTIGELLFSFSHYEGYCQYSKI